MFTPQFCKAGQSPLHPPITASCVLIAFGRVERGRDGNYNNINLVINQVKWLMDIWADEHSSQMLHNRHKKR